MLLALVASARAQLLGFVQSDEAQFLASYAELTADSYSMPLPPAAPPRRLGTPGPLPRRRT